MSVFPFEATFADLQAQLDEFVSVVFATLESEFLVLPKGEGFVEYPVFERGYEALKRATSSFSNFSPDVVLPLVVQAPIAIIVLRAMLGLTPPEWAYMAARRTGVEIPQGAARTLDRKIRMHPLNPLGRGGVTLGRVGALIETACGLLAEGAPAVESDQIHRFDKADTKEGLAALRAMADLGVPYCMLLYERFLGRPFAGHRDSVSELVGGRLEVQIEELLSGAGISYRKTKRAERVLNFSQSPDFIIPDEFNPRVVIEAKITEDDGTARDKVTRIKELEHLSKQDQPQGTPRYEVIACIGGRGFGIRREDMRKLILATRGKVFTLKIFDRMVDCTRLQEFRTR